MKPLTLRNLLSYAPQSKPRYFVTIKDQKGVEVLCGDPKVTRTLLVLMNQGAVNGGAACHWGGPSAMAEMMSATHALMFKEAKWFDHYNFVNDIGHAENGIYALRANLGFGDLSFDELKKFRSIETRLTGHGESHLYPEGVLLSNGPLGSAVAQAQGLAIADKVSGKNRKTILSVSDGAAMEGEAKEAFAAIPGLMSKGKLNPFIMLVSDNNTKLGGRIDQDSFSMKPTFSSLATLGWEIIKVNGHDLQACYLALEKAQNLSEQNKAVAIICETIKGYGLKSTAESASGGHGYPLKAYDPTLINVLNELWENKVPEEFLNWANELMKKPASSTASTEKTEKTQAGIARALIKARKAGKPIFSLSSDLQSSTGVKDFHKEFPDSYLDIGVAESNMVSVAAGMSKAGFIPVVDTFAAFGVTKGNLPLIMAALSSAPIIGIFSHTGFQDAADGASHQSLTYLSAVSSIPYTQVVVPATSEEAEKLLTLAIDEIELARLEGRAGTSYLFFIGRENFPVSLNKESHLGKPQTLTQGKDAVVVASGPMVFKALKAAEILKEQNISVTVVNHHLINQVDVEYFKNILNHSSKLITVEDHQLVGGMGAQLVHQLKMNGLEFKYKGLGVKGSFGQSSYTADELYKKFGIDEMAIAQAVVELK